MRYMGLSQEDLVPPASRGVRPHRPSTRHWKANRSHLYGHVQGIRQG